MARAPREKLPKKVETLTHDEASRKHIPTAEYQSVMDKKDQTPIQLAYERRNRDLDPQLVWRSKDEQDWSDLVVQAPPLFIQEKIHPKVLIDDLRRRTQRSGKDTDMHLDLFDDFNGLRDDAARTEFYQHDANWSNRMILGDSLQVMASLAEREGLRGKVQCIYMDPPYGIKFNSNFQWSTTSRDVKDGKSDHITREPEQVKAFRDTWRDGIHSYLTYLRDRLTVARDLLTESGSIFVQIGDENVHRVRALMDEVFGEVNFCSLISYKTSIGLGSQGLDNTANYLVWYCKNSEQSKFRQILRQTTPGEEGASRYKTVRLPDLTEYRVKHPSSEPLPDGARLFRDQGMTSRTGSNTTIFDICFRGKQFTPKSGGWRTSRSGLNRIIKADRILPTGQTLSYRKFFDDFAAISVDNFWSDVSGGVTSRSDPKVYVVQTGTNIIQRCVLMTTDPGDLVLDPTCGSGTTAYVAEQWGRRWITIDTSRVALALARARVMGARYPWYLLADSPEGQCKEAEITRTVPSVEVASTTTTNLGPKPILFENLPDTSLLEFGVPTDWLDDVRGATEDTLLDLAEHLPGEAAEALLELATGGIPAQPVRVAADLDSFEHPDAQRRFRVMTNVDELALALEYPWEKWTVFLHPAQREIVEGQYDGPARVSGSAGTGKTIVSLHRAAYLARSNPDAKVLLTTFSLPLAKTLRRQLRHLIGDDADLQGRIVVRAVDEVGIELYEMSFGTPRILTPSMIRTLLQGASKHAEEHEFSTRFLEAEWADVRGCMAAHHLGRVPRRSATWT